MKKQVELKLNALEYTFLEPFLQLKTTYITLPEERYWIDGEEGPVLMEGESTILHQLISKGIFIKERQPSDEFDSSKPDGEYLSVRNYDFSKVRFNVTETKEERLVLAEDDETNIDAELGL